MNVSLIKIHLDELERFGGYKGGHNRCLQSKCALLEGGSHALESIRIERYSMDRVVADNLLEFYVEWEVLGGGNSDEWQVI
tara:strand:- start:288 stop:530 length:243 start_codon:yes stop_codon:yes gene_type:complete